MIKYAPQYLRSAASVIEQYDGGIPFAAFLKNYYKLNPKFGSKDRKYIGQLCYAYFRTGKALVGSIEDKIKASLFLSEQNDDEWDLLFGKEWLENKGMEIDAKWKFICSFLPGTDPGKLFEWVGELNDGMDAVQFSNAHLIQPDLFLRIRPGNEKTVVQKLAGQQIAFEQISGSCLSLSNSTRIDTVLSIDKEVVVQDYSSQRVADFFPKEIKEQREIVSVWDCCAASGGKSLLAYDQLRNIQLTVSDIRASILHNLKERFRNAGVKNYHSFIADIGKEGFKIENSKFKLLICDAPCSGSGTWGRTPEQLSFFKTEKITEYASLQKRIVANTIPYVENEGYLLYITCSVFKKENEEVVAFIQQNENMQLVKMELLKGYDKKADSMFAALFQLRG